MIARVLAVVPFAVLALAASSGQCNTGSAHCCNSVKQASDKSMTDMLGLVGIVLEDVTGQIGVDCSPLDLLSSGGGQCNQHPVCCTDNQFNGFINLGCSPININA
ncbi:fungal hydrophobin [Coniophora puteana RWD-64-598 SS2]|uniref:Hydrophobin n=1 Tax=Coniophora puteana (strain RWD-64-598) TaxID=741705 RepID=A0A5M3MV65_CONPW|nr:fungal hydrophobin [Coniophora puteana RWD-64-598 SS2]EIW83013.1 fungal hydrophobin [Coniophora puteana RWD-64-598 SS2]